MKFNTKVVHAGIESEPQTGAVMTPIFQTSTYAQRSPGDHQGYAYARGDNPTRTPLQTQLAALEQGDRGLVFGSGMAATDAVINLLKAGDHVVAGDDLYGGTYRHFSQVAVNRGIEFSFVNPLDTAALEAAFKSNTKLVWMESLTNPLLNVIPIEKIAKLAHSKGALLAVDNTFMSPCLMQPLTLGADIVMHSMTKYINGHSDVLMGGLVIKEQSPEWLGGVSLGTRLKFLQNAIGGISSPFECFLVLRGIKTLSVRMQRHCENAIAVANFLEGHAKVEKVLFPGLPSHPGHQLACEQAKCFGGMVSFFVKGGLPETKAFMEKLKLFVIAESLGGVESLANHPAIMTHASVPKEVREASGITDTLIRLSVGIEDKDDIIADLDQALG